MHQVLHALDMSAVSVQCSLSLLFGPGLPVSHTAAPKAPLRDYLSPSSADEFRGEQTALSQSPKIHPNVHSEMEHVKFGCNTTLSVISQAWPLSTPYERPPRLRTTIWKVKGCMSRDLPRIPGLYPTTNAQPQKVPQWSSKFNPKPPSIFLGVFYLPRTQIDTNTQLINHKLYLSSEMFPLNSVAVCIC